MKEKDETRFLVDYGRDGRIDVGAFVTNWNPNAVHYRLEADSVGVQSLKIAFAEVDQPAAGVRDADSFLKAKRYRYLWQAAWCTSRSPGTNRSSSSVPSSLLLGISNCGKGGNVIR